MNTARQPSVVDSCTLIYVEVDQNSNKVWQGNVYNDGTLIVEWGRVGYQLQRRVYTLKSLALAQSKLARTRRQKIRKGYTEAQLVNPGKQIEFAVKESELETIAAKEIEHGKDPRAKQLIRYLVAVNIHNITSQTNITYDVNTGNFKTPLGLVTPDAIALARDYLAQIIAAGQTNNRQTRSAINNYLRLIPQNLGHKIDYQRFFQPQEIQRQQEILNALAAAVLQPTNPPRDCDRVFECSITRVPGSTLKGKQIFRQIRKLYESTINHNHFSAVHKLRRLYEIDISDLASKA